ncbi:hypothetical protein N7509_007460, partial [Penicillium cosmopolitanum]
PWLPTLSTATSQPLLAPGLHELAFPAARDCQWQTYRSATTNKPIPSTSITTTTDTTSSQQPPIPLPATLPLYPALHPTVMAPIRSHPETSVMPLPRSIVLLKYSSRAGTAKPTRLDYFVCVHIPSTVATLAPQPSATTGPTPQKPGIVTSCQKYHLIKDGKSCWSICMEAGITLV